MVRIHELEKSAISQAVHFVFRIVAVRIAQLFTSSYYTMSSKGFIYLDEC